MSDERAAYQNITIETVDGAILDWFDRTLDVHVEHPGGSRKKVPVKIASGERWVTSREKRGIRDEKGVLILPIISIRRTSVEPDTSMQALGTETANLQISRRISPKTNLLQNLNAKRVPREPMKPVVYEVTSIPFPERKIISYDLQIQTQYITQMNSILEKIYASLDIQDSFVAPVDNEGRPPQHGKEYEERSPTKGHYFVGFLDSSNDSEDNFEEFTDSERIIKYSTRLRVPAVLQLDPEGKRPSVQVQRTAFGLRFGEERVHFVDDLDELELIFSDGKVREP